jgi:hypothetical protein
MEECGFCEFASSLLVGFGPGSAEGACESVYRSSMLGSTHCVVGQSRHGIGMLNGLVILMQLSNGWPDRKHFLMKRNSGNGR